MDYHDEVMVDWREDILGKAESFCHSNILNAAPHKFRFWVWYVILGSLTVVALLTSFLLSEQCSWISSMFGNVAAGLIASIVLLLFSSAKEKNLNYYDRIVPELSDVVFSLQIAFNKLYWEERGLRNKKLASQNDEFSILENYRVFSMKVFLTHKVLLDLYRQVVNADQIQYYPLHCDTKFLDDHEKNIENFEEMIAIDYSHKVVGKFDDYEKAYLLIWGNEMDLMRHLLSYIEELKKTTNSIRFKTNSK